MAKNHTLLWGYHPVWEALQARRRQIYGLLVAQDKKGRREKMVRLAEKNGVEVKWASVGELTDLVGHDRHQGVAAQVAGYPFASLEQILAVDAKASFLLVLDQIVDPQNLGAMARTAQCAGVHGIVITKDRAAMPTAAASKASAGALEHMLLARVTNLAKTINSLKAKGVWIAGADQHGASAAFEAELTGPLAIVIGSEGKGLRPLVRKQCDFTLSIPQIGPIGSLNASVAAAVLMYEAFRQRRKQI